MRRILVVDDDLHTRLAIRTWLKRCGFRVAIADGGLDGLAALDDAAFDLMIVDVFMPSMHKPFRPATLLSVIDECLSQAEPHRKFSSTLAAVADRFALTEERWRD
jgi:CheY-like chemotaxis protein